MRWLLGLVATLVLAASGLWLALSRWPLADALARTGTGPVRVGRVEGTVLDGRLSGLKVGPLPLPDARVRLRPLALLSGRAEADLAAMPPAPALRAEVAARRRDVEGRVTGRLPVAAGFGMPVGAVLFEGAAARFANGRCAAASGAVVAELAVGFERIGLTDRLSGVPRCDGPDLLLPFRDPAGRAGLDVHLTADGRWRGALRLTPPADVGPTLLNQGFRREGGTYVLEVSGPR